MWILVILQCEIWKLWAARRLVPLRGCSRKHNRDNFFILSIWSLYMFLFLFKIKEVFFDRKDIIQVIKFYIYFLKITSSSFINFKVTENLHYR